MSENAKPKNIVGAFEHQPSGCFWYRTKHVIDLFNNNGIESHFIPINNDIDFYDDMKSVQVYGIYPFSFEKVLRTIKEDGKKIVYDIDDALDLIDTSNPFFYSVKKDASSALGIFKHADHITVANEELVEYARQRTAAPISIIPNCYDPADWKFDRPKREGFRIGFAGSCTHVPDLIEIVPVIQKLQSKFPNVKFLIMGFGPGTYEEWLTNFKYISPPEGIYLLNELDKRLKTIEFEWVPFVDYTIYPQVLTNMALDIGICPLLDTPFNRHKSPSKAMEYALSGALSLSSDVRPYNKEPTSVLVDDWEKALTHFIDNPDEIKWKHAAHMKWIQENRHIQTQFDKLKDIYAV